MHSPRKFRQPVATQGALLRKGHCCVKRSAHSTWPTCSLRSHAASLRMPSYLRFSRHLRGLPFHFDASREHPSPYNSALPTGHPCRFPVSAHDCLRRAGTRHSIWARPAESHAPSPPNQQDLRGAGVKVPPLPDHRKVITGGGAMVRGYGLSYRDVEELLAAAGSRWIRSSRARRCLTSPPSRYCIPSGRRHC